MSLFFQKFEKLDSLLHKGIDFKVDVTLIFSKLRLRFISLNQCDLEACNVSTMSDNCTTLQHLQLIGCKCPRGTKLLLSENLKMFEMNQCSYVESLDVSRPKQLESLIIILIERFPLLYFIARTKFAYLKNFELGGYLQYELDAFGHFENLGSLEKLTLHNSSTFESPIPNQFMVYDFKNCRFKFLNSPNFQVLRIVDPNPDVGNILSCEFAKGDKKVSVILILKNQSKDRKNLKLNPKKPSLIPIRIEKTTIEIIEEEIKEEMPKSVVEECVIS